MKVRANGIDIEVEDTGSGGTQAQRPVVLLVMGLGMQLIAWPAEFVQALEDAGFRVVRLDNRDIGLSQKMDHLGVPNILWESFKFRIGLRVRAPYTLHDMAMDALGVLDALQVRQAHVVGVSMGGMIAQRIALAAPGRVLSLASIMSSSGARRLPGPSGKVMRALMGRPVDRSEDALVDHYARLFRLIGSPAFPLEESVLRDRVLRATRRSFHPAGTVRQMTAIAADSARADELARIRIPTLVQHGTADPLVPFACGQDTARRIPGAQLHAIDGMGHDLPPGVVQRLLQRLVPHLQASAPAMAAASA